MTSFLSCVSGGAVDSTVLLSLAIILCAFLIEDVATVIVGVLAADGIVPIPVAFISLYIGIALGDTMFYALGSFARTHPRLAHYIDHNFTAPFRSWLEHRYAFTVFSGHFVPGLRSTTYIASGFFRLPLSTYIPMAIAGGMVLLTTLFFVAYWFGGLTSGWVSHVRWGIAAIFLLTLFFIGRHNFLAYRAKRDTLLKTNNTSGT